MGLCKTEDSRGKTKFEIPNTQQNCCNSLYFWVKFKFLCWSWDHCYFWENSFWLCSRPQLAFTQSYPRMLPILLLFLLPTHSLTSISFSSPCFESHSMLPSGLRSLSLGRLWMLYLHKSGITLRFNKSKADPYHWVSLAKYPLSFLLPLWTISSCLYLASVTSLPYSP